MHGVARPRERRDPAACPTSVRSVCPTGRRRPPGRADRHRGADRAAPRASFVHGVFQTLMDREAREGRARDLSKGEIQRRMTTLDALGCERAPAADRGDRGADDPGPARHRHRTRDRRPRHRRDRDRLRRPEPRARLLQRDPDPDREPVRQGRRRPDRGRRGDGGGPDAAADDAARLRGQRPHRAELRGDCGVQPDARLRRDHARTSTSRPRIWSTPRRTRSTASGGRSQTTRSGPTSCSSHRTSSGSMPSGRRASPCGSRAACSPATAGRSPASCGVDCSRRSARRACPWCRRPARRRRPRSVDRSGRPVARSARVRRGRLRGPGATARDVTRERSADRMAGLERRDPGDH